MEDQELPGYHPPEKKGNKIPATKPALGTVWCSPNTLASIVSDLTEPQRAAIEKVIDIRPTTEFRTSPAAADLKRSEGQGDHSEPDAHPNTSAQQSHSSNSERADFKGSSTKYKSVPDNLHQSHTFKDFEADRNQDNLAQQNKATESKTRKRKARKDAQDRTTNSGDADIAEDNTHKGKAQTTKARSPSKRKTKPIKKSDFAYEETTKRQTKRQKAAGPSERYLCTEEDEATIEYIESSRLNKILVSIGDIELTREDMKCLLNKDGWLGTLVMNAYIHLIRDKEQGNRDEGSVLLENTFFTSQAYKRKTDLTWIQTQSAKHLKNDMLQNLEERYYSKVELDETNWQDIHVSQWQIVEEIKQHVQHDSCSKKKKIEQSPCREDAPGRMGLISENHPGMTAEIPACSPGLRPAPKRRRRGQLPPINPRPVGPDIGAGKPDRACLVARIGLSHGAGD
ncbi:hypothetical protein EJB05_47538, partial [Eragrostis curvula]